MTGGSKGNRSRQRDKQNGLHSVGERSAPNRESETRRLQCPQLCDRDLTEQEQVERRFDQDRGHDN